MRNYIFPALILAFCTGMSCWKSDLKNVPACIERKIEKSKNENSGVLSVNEYLYQGKKVYLFSMDCCDRFNEIYDANCQYICSPSGGIAGGGDGKCTDFHQTAEFIREVWKKK